MPKSVSIVVGMSCCIAFSVVVELIVTHRLVWLRIFVMCL